MVNCIHNLKFPFLFSLAMTVSSSFVVVRICNSSSSVCDFLTWVKNVMDLTDVILLQGIDNRVRRKFKGMYLMPNIGYGSAKATRHMMPSGFRKVSHSTSLSSSFSCFLYPKTVGEGYAIKFCKPGTSIRTLIDFDTVFKFSLLSWPGLRCWFTTWRSWRFSWCRTRNSALRLPTVCPPRTGEKSFFLYQFMVLCSQ